MNVSKVRAVRKIVIVKCIDRFFYKHKLVKELQKEI